LLPGGWLTFRGGIHTRQTGGNVVGFSALTGKQYSAKTAPSKGILSQLRERFPTLEAFWKEEYGYGFERLTNSEANYLLTIKGQDADSIRARISSARQYQGTSSDEGTDSNVEDPQIRYSDDGNLIEGFVLPSGEVFLVPENIQSGKLWPTIRHEVGVHVGRVLQSAQKFQRLLDSIESRKGEDSATGEAIRKAMARVPKDTAPQYVREETLAYMLSDAKNVGIVRQFIAMVKSALVKLGFDPAMLTVDDLTAMVDAAMPVTVYTRRTTQPALHEEMRALCYNSTPNRFTDKTKDKSLA
jgi:hypothetical protein